MSMSQISVNNLTFCYEGSFDNIFENVSFSIDTNWKLGFVGRNGKGKTTFMHLLLGKYLYKGAISTNIKFDYFPYRIEDEQRSLAAVEFIEALKPGCETWRVICELDELGEEADILYRAYESLSPGEQAKILLAVLFSGENDFLLIDEPTNHLDINKMIWLEKTLKNYKGTIILVSHDRYFMDNVINKVYLLTKRGIEVYHGNYSYYIKESENRLLLELKNYKDQQKQITAMENSIKRLKEYGRLCGPSGGEIFFRRAASIEKRLEKLEKLDKPEEKKKLNITFDMDSRSGKDVLTINNLYLSYGTKEIFNNLNLSIKYQDRLCLVGDNGVGKSTLIKEILKGNNSIKLGSNIKIGYIPQEIGFEDINLSVLEEARKYFIGPEKYLRSALFKYLFAGENIHKKIKYLSGGEKVRLKIFCLIQNSYNFLILDEPTNHIDIDTREMLEESLQEFTGTILFVSHDRYFINKIATSIIEIKNKNITRYIGNYDDYREKINKI